MVDFDLIKKLIKIVEDADITGLAVEEKGMKVEVRREKNIVSHSVAPQVAHASAPAPHPSEASSKSEERLEEGVVPIVSPMVGTFYKSPSPDSPPYVETGDSIDSGKVVCIIEAMKLFNEIESEVKGTVVKILVENGQPVEYGQTLMLVKKA